MSMQFFNENPIGKAIKWVVDALPNAACFAATGFKGVNTYWIGADSDDKDEYARQINFLNDFLKEKSSKGLNHFGKGDDSYFMDDKGYLYIAEKKDEKAVWRKLKLEEYAEKGFGKITAETQKYGDFLDAAKFDTYYGNDVDSIRYLEVCKKANVRPAGKPVGAAVLHNIGEVTGAAEGFTIGALLVSSKNKFFSFVGKATQIICGVLGLVKMADIALESLGKKTATQVAKEGGEFLVGLSNAMDKGGAGDDDLVMMAAAGMDLDGNGITDL